MALKRVLAWVVVALAALTIGHGLSLVLDQAPVCRGERVGPGQVCRRGAQSVTHDQLVEEARTAGGAIIAFGVSGLVLGALVLRRGRRAGSSG